MATSNASSEKVPQSSSSEPQAKKFVIENYTPLRSKPSPAKETESTSQAAEELRQIAKEQIFNSGSLKEIKVYSNPPHQVGLTMSLMVRLITGQAESPSWGEAREFFAAIERFHKAVMRYDPDQISPQNVDALTDYVKEVVSVSVSKQSKSVLGAHNWLLKHYSLSGGEPITPVELLPRSVSPRKRYLQETASFRQRKVGG